jgi:hypothetical protein
MTILWQGLVPTDSIDTVTERVAKLAKRAARVGFPAPTLDIGVASIEDDNISWTAVTIEGEPLKLGAFSLVGTVSSLEDGSAFVTYAPGAVRIPDDIAAALNVNWCDHCRAMRQRRDTYLVHSAEEGIVQVGSSCIKDFLGHDPAIIVSFLKMVESLDLTDEVGTWSMAATRFYPLRDILTATARAVVREGYINKDKAYAEERSSTVETTRSILVASGAQRKYLDMDYPITEEVEPLVDLTFAEVEALEPTNEWQADLARLFTQRGVQWRHIGIVASSVILALRKREQAAVSHGDSEFMWSKGERVTFDAVLTLKRGFEGAYGYSYILRMTPVGTTNDVLHFASASATTNELEEGETYTVTATVKNHELDKRTERPTTVITRAKYEKENA